MMQPRDLKSYPWVGTLRAVTCVSLMTSFFACGPLRYTVSNSAFSNLTADKQMRLFDAENDVSLTTDEKGQMEEALRAIRGDVKQAQRALGRLDGDNAKSAGLVKMYRGRIQYLEMAADYMTQRIIAQDDVIIAAQAKFELAKALIVKKNKMVGADKLTIRDFEKQADEQMARKKDTLSGLERKKSALTKARLNWLKLRDDVAASSLSATILPGDEEQPPWQTW